MINLSSAQLAVVEAPLGVPQQVLASAGSGKTRVLTERVRYLLRNTKKDGVIALTFTNKAAEEMQSRLAGTPGLEERCWISTIHSVAQRIVDSYGHSIGLPEGLHIFEREQDRKTVFLQALRDGGIDVESFLEVQDSRVKKQREQVIQGYLDGFSVVKRELLLEHEAIDRFPLINDFWGTFQSYQSALMQSGGMDFDDILVFAHRILLEQPWCGQIYRAKYKHLCVDEAQDLNRAQYELLRVLCANELKSIMMVGDPNQMVYGFNGSSHEFLCTRFVEDFSPQRYALKENYRSSQAVIRAANNLKPGSQVGVSYALAGQSVVKGFDTEQLEAQWIGDMIERLLGMGVHPEIEGKISLGNMAIVGRNRFVFHAIEEQLKDRKVPFALKKGERQAEPSSVFGQVLDLAIRIRLNPKNWVDGKKLCTVLKVRAPLSWNNSLLLYDLSTAAIGAAIPFPDVQSRLLRAIADIDIDKPNVPKLCRDFAEALESHQLALENVVGPSELEMSLLELQEFRELWTKFRSKGHGETLVAFRNALALGEVSERVEAGSLTLSTVHTMKGLEKDIVFLVGMCEGVFPDYRATSAKDIAEELNTAFVAVTRSRRWLYITYPKRRRMPWGDEKVQMPSRFVSLIAS